jgi:outer membrane protein assembly factor BamB
MRGPRLTAQAGALSVPGTHVHVESGRGRGALAAVLLVPADPPDAFSAALSRLHGGSLDLEERLGRLGSTAPGIAFLVGLGQQVWALPSERFRVRLVRIDRLDPITEPQVVAIRPGDRIELLDGETVVGAVAAPGVTERAPEARRPLRKLPRPSKRAAIAVGVGAIVLLAGAAAFRGKPGAPRQDAWAKPPTLEERVVGALTEGANVSSPKAAPLAALEAPVAAAETEKPAEAPPPTREASNGAAPSGAAGAGWTFAARGPITSSPLVVDGWVVCGSRDSTLYCLRADTGELAWRVAVGSGIGSSPRAAGDRCFVGTYGGDLLACDLATGRTVWRATTKGKIVSSPCVLGGMVVVGSYDRSIHAFDAATGKRAWTVATRGAVRASAEPIGEGVVAVGSTDGTIRALAVADGKVRWTRRTNAAIDAAVAWDASRGRVLAAGRDGQVLCLDAGTGNVVWKTPLGAEINAQPRVTERLVVVGTGKGRLHALDPDTGKKLWNVSATRGFDARPLVRGEELVAPSYDGVVHVVRLADGSVLERRPLGEEIWSSPSAAADLVVLGTLAGKLHAIPLP